MSLRHLSPAISAASRTPYLSTLPKYDGTEMTMSFDVIAEFSKKVLIFLK
jgi:hypothetical protein